VTEPSCSAARNSFAGVARPASAKADNPGAKFRQGKGLRVFSDGKEIARSADLTRVTGKL
jgi:hypothetical protein